MWFVVCFIPDVFFYHNSLYHSLQISQENACIISMLINAIICSPVRVFQFFISALSFATFAVSPELPQNRLQLSFTLLLTSVTFKFVINQSLPKISYLTYMVSIPAGTEQCPHSHDNTWGIYSYKKIVNLIAKTII